MHAHFSAHVYHRHSHDSYSFGMTETGAQAFTCRGGSHVSAAGMVMLFNPDDPHDGHCATGHGFTYRMVHIDPGLVTDLLADVRGRPSGLPLFPCPVAGDARLARSLRSLHAALTGTATPLEQHEQLTGTMALLTRHAVLRDRRTGPPRAPATSSSAAQAALRIRDLLHDGYASPLTADDLAVAADCSRYAAYRAFSCDVRARAERLPAPAPAPRSPPAPGHGDASRPGRHRRRLRGPGPPDALVPPVLRGHARRLPAGRLLTVVPPWRRPP